MNGNGVTEHIIASDGQQHWFTDETVTRCRKCVFLILDGNMRTRCAFFGAPMGEMDFCSKAKPHAR